jgi:hypothetical protein
VSARNPLPDYPRPQLTRPRWRSLNGVWQLEKAAAGEDPPSGRRLAGRVVVPYPVGSALSGVPRHEQRLWYRRTFTVPTSWHVGSGQRLLVNFGAVDYDATVYVNGEEVATHRGGYTHFTADVTDALRPTGAQELVVGVTDLGDRTWQPVGKQRNVPDRGILYTGASGIWQTVWMEPVSAEGHVRALHTSTDIDASTLTVDVDAPPGLTVAAVVLSGGTAVGSATGEPGRPLVVRVPHARLWSPDDPYLYRLRVTLRRHGHVVDSVGSSFGMREIGTARDRDGRLRITLNHRTTFLLGTLDQGYWPDGIYTAPTDEAMRSDLERTKALGFNTVRKHMKVEPDRWYADADRLGLLVWQDMPAMKARGTPPPAARREFERELHEVIAQHDSWTSVIAWVPFNEGWGEWSRRATGRIADDVEARDPTRLVDAHSGVNCCTSHGDSGAGDVIDWHSYTGPALDVPDAHRVAVDGEHGGFGLEVPGHMWFDGGHAYRMARSRAELTRLYVVNQRRVLERARRCGLSGAVYTQTTDVEHEVNGLFTYDRRVEKVEPGPVRRINEMILRHADEAPAAFRARPCGHG